MPRKKKTEPVEEVPEPEPAATTTRKDRASRNTKKRKAEDAVPIVTDDNIEAPAPKKSKKSPAKRVYAAKKRAGFTKAGLEEWYESYLDSPSDDAIGPNGVGRLLEDLKVDAEHVSVLMLAWKLNAAKMGYFSRDEFVGGLEPMKVDTPEALAKVMTTFENELDNDDVRKAVYMYAFDFGKDNPEAKNIDVASAAGFLEITLKGNPHTSHFTSFLRGQSTAKVVTADFWKMWWDFAHKVDLDLKDYDSDMAWPSLIDEYVDTLKSGKC